MSNKDSLGDRMKRYENVSRNYLTRRVPVIIRIDGRAFHTFTRGLKKPFDRILMDSMQHTMKALCENIQGCVFGYTQSDEITLVLTDYDKITTDGWFGYNIQKMASVSASMATVQFNKCLEHEYSDIFVFSKDEPEEYVEKLSEKLGKAMFDSRAFSMPKDEVCNCLIWRQQDATRNSIESVGQSNFSHKELHGKTCNMIQDMLWKERGINWNDLSTDCKRGACCYRTRSEETVSDKDGNPVKITRNKWVIDRDIPIFTQDRAFIENLI